MAKLGWRLMNETEAFWSRVLLKKYRRQGTGLHVFEIKSGSSHVWRGIVKSSSALEGVNWIIGNGQIVSFWADVWVGEKPLSCLALLPVSGVLMGRRVCDYWVAGRGWDWLSFNQLLPASTLLRLPSVALSKDENMEDKLIWNSDKFGPFSVNKAYRAVNESSNQEMWIGWKRIWSIQTKQRVRIFLWLLAHEKIMTNYNCWRRRLTGNPIFLVCEAHEESCLHAVHDCKQAKMI